MIARVLPKICAVLCLGLALPAHADEGRVVGTWRLNLEQSIPPQGRRFQPFTIVIRESGAMLDFTQHTTLPNGRAHALSHRTATDGVERDLPGMPGARVAMTLLPSGVIDAKLRFADGSLQNKVCLLQVSLDQQVCFATITAPNGNVSFFRHVLDRVK